MKKLIILFLIVVVVAIAVVSYFFSAIVSKGVVAGVETIGPKMTQTGVALDDFKLSLLAGGASLKGLKIDNPQGYAAEQAFSVGAIDIELTPNSLFSDTIHIKKIHINTPTFSFEQTLNKNNLKEILENVQSFTGGGSDSTASEPSESPESSSGEEAPQKKIIIDSLIIEGGKAEVILLGQSLNVDLPTITQQDIGKDSGGVSSADAFKIVFAEVTKSITELAAEAGQKILSGDLDINAVGDEVEAIGKDAKDKAEDVVKGLKNLF